MCQGMDFPEPRPATSITLWDGLLLREIVVYEYGVNHSRPFSGIGMTYKQPVLFSHRSWPDSVFHEVVIDLHFTVFDIFTKAVPV